MAVRIRMSMHGKRHQKIFHLVAANQRARRDGKPIELLGVYNPHLKPGETQKTIEWSTQRIRYWLNVGAIPSKSAERLLQLGGLLSSPATSSAAAAGPAPSSSPETGAAPSQPTA
ncbi:ribosomal protein S16 [Epithele typhae]|uniref:ribosomal protein S16 n=1 Tax=Epithele typhae TaxID=378194 RepID=UPI0020085570|nr:ribosomal protein S16 [Epithele typhae]KAH9944143.1 ribosomal protein S16 [Epithele typhae]